MVEPWANFGRPLKGMLKKPGEFIDRQLLENVCTEASFNKRYGFIRSIHITKSIDPNIT